MFMRLDGDKKVKFWNSESIVIPYTNPKTGRYHRYFPDLFVEYWDGRKVLIEIKPYAQTKPPKLKPRQKERTFLNEVATYVQNQAKWESAKRYCDARGWEFQVLTEKQMKGVFL